LFSESKPRLGKVTVIRDPISGLRQVVPELFKEREPRLGNEPHVEDWILHMAATVIFGKRKTRLGGESVFEECRTRLGSTCVFVLRRMVVSVISYHVMAARRA
jgi:hypothetical protein